MMMNTDPVAVRTVQCDHRTHCNGPHGRQAYGLDQPVSCHDEHWAAHSDAATASSASCGTRSVNQSRAEHGKGGWVHDYRMASQEMPRLTNESVLPFASRAAAVFHECLWGRCARRAQVSCEDYEKPAA